jgi:hypothetical protein
MTVYLAFTNIHYEGVFEGSMRVFSTQEKAEHYRDQLGKRYGHMDMSHEIKPFVVDEEK